MARRAWMRDYHGKLGEGVSEVDVSMVNDKHYLEKPMTESVLARWLLYQTTSRTYKVQGRLAAAPGTAAYS